MQEQKFYNASCDAIFKAIFCKHKDLLESLLEETLQRKIKVNKIISPEILKPNVHIKNKTLDVLATSNNEIFNIELNIGYKSWLNRRNAAYIFSKYSEDTKVSEAYSKMNHFIQINLTSGLPKEKPITSHYTLVDQETKEEFIDNLEIYEYNLDKLKKLWYNEPKKAKHKLLVSLVCNKEELHQISKENASIKKIEGEVIRMNEDKEFVEFISQEEDMKKIQNSLIADAKEEGMEKGIEQGTIQKQLEIAQNMVNKNMDIDDIADITGLTKEQIKNLK